MEEKKKNKMDKTGKECGYQKDKVCGENCGLFCVGLKGCVAHSTNMHIKEVADMIDKTNLKLHYLEKKIEIIGENLKG